jgi:hypothetical protein
MTSPADIRIIRSPERGDVEVSDDALVLIAACINEALEAVGEWEFSIRIGFTIEEARDLKAQIESVLEQRGGHGS